MLVTEQTKGQSVYQHGQSATEMILDLVGHLRDGHDLTGWKLPSWCNQYAGQIAAHVHPIDITTRYTLHHDCGKPFCRTVDAEGKVHFPDHAEVSRKTYLEATGDVVVSNLIGWDMAIHTASAEEIDRLLREDWTPQDATTLLLAALAEIHSNARMFGGIESTSFKSKWTKVDRRGKQICKFLWEGK